MASDVTESPDFYRLWAWFEANKKRVAWGAAIVVGAGLIIWFVLWQQEVKRTAADEALSAVVLAPMFTPGERPSADAYMRLAAKYPDSSAGGRAVLLAAASLFTEGNYPQAMAQFERFRHEYRDSPLLGQAVLGVATCLDAQGKTNQAIDSYQDIIKHHPGEPVVPQAKLSLAQLYENQQRPELAMGLLADVARDGAAGSLATAAGLKLEELRTKYPSQFQAQPPAPAPPSQKYTIEKR